MLFVTLATALTLLADCSSAQSATSTNAPASQIPKPSIIDENEASTVIPQSCVDYMKVYVEEERSYTTCVDGQKYLLQACSPVGRVVRNMTVAPPHPANHAHINRTQESMLSKCITNQTQQVKPQMQTFDCGTAEAIIKSACKAPKFVFPDACMLALATLRQVATDCVTSVYGNAPATAGALNKTENH